MKRQYLTYLLPAICLLSACQADYDEPGHPEAASGEALEIRVAETVTTVSGSGSTRSYESGASTKFDKGDRIGIIILGEDGKILADNVPYVYDGAKWDFDADNTEGKQRIYYDATMYKYIAYYPYTVQADVKIEGNDAGTQEKINSLMQVNIDGYFKAVPLFTYRENQSKEEDFRCCDPMVWSKTGFTTSPSIKVELSHIRNCFVLDPKVRWRLANGETIKYQPRNYQIALTYGSKDKITATEITASDTGFDDFYIYLGDYKNPQYLKKYNVVDNTRMDILFHAQDGSYRYILGDETEYTFNWEYTYRNGKTYGGVQTIRPKESRNTRFIHDETIDMGDLVDDKVKVGDFFCSKNREGYPLPYDAAELLDRNTCVGVVFHVGHYVGGYGTDQTNYTDIVGSKDCHGYVMALTDACQDSVQWSVGRGDNFPLVEGINITGTGGYNGYMYRQKVIDKLEELSSKFERKVTIEHDFPAFYVCEIYGTKDWHQTLTPPTANTSGWYLPALHQVNDMSKDIMISIARKTNSFTFNDNGNIMKTLATIRCKLPQDCEYLKYILPDKSIGWWTSSQVNNQSNVHFVDLSGGSSQGSTGVYATRRHEVRPILSY
ncbi:MAG: fimbrillin family protein [Muribaculaceae bacterium]|nr:fimbrillin family protein [Muribaculaceae bacterium]